MDTAPLKTFPEPRGGHAAVGPEVDVLRCEIRMQNKEEFCHRDEKRELVLTDRAR